MSSLIVEVSKIQQVLPHPNAERLELAQVKGWQCVVPKGRYSAGNLVTYVPPDTVFPAELSDRLGITKYLSHGRVRCARLRGEPSFGVIFDLENPVWTEGQDVAAFYGITKYVPPLRISSGDAERAHPLFVSYTEIENMRNFPAVIADGEEVVASEKIHGTNCRLGLIDCDGEKTWMAGSKTVRRKMPAEEKLATDLYWHPYSSPNVRALIESVAADAKQVILFGEVYGKVQSLRYGVPGGIAFRAFDLLVDGNYADYDRFADLCKQFGVESAPLIFRGPFSLETIKLLAEGNSAIPGAANIREGVVVKPTAERTDPKIGRVVLKYIGDGYLFGNESDTDDV
ncbi:MAG TPA: RNA ligase (ATP) [Tepidisphaeraceae bacterium]|jgi:RNA ligase (TIGR02306 family)|nr:RNA ligase (ATP) [Tepidisphaeraceae bacterium]